VQRFPINYLMRVDQPFLDAIDAWRRHQPDLPSRAEAIRRLVIRALTDEPPAAS
jgi:hypothetical protein